MSYSFQAPTVINPLLLMFVLAGLEPTTSALPLDNIKGRQGK